MSEERAGDAIVFSVYNAKRTNYWNEITHEIAKEVLEKYDVPYIECEGVYLGESEQSFIVSTQYVTLVRLFCWTHEQECYLEVKEHKHGTSKAYFVYPDGRREFQGYLRSVSKERALQEVGYTYREDLDTYWIITDTDETIVRNTA